MPQDLTDADRAAIKAVMYDHDYPEAIYRSGLAAGRERAIEEAAQVCDQMQYSITFPRGAMAAKRMGISQCAAAIRAIK